MRAWLFLGAVNAGLAVGLGAYAAHGLAADPYASGLADKASRYQMYHALALLAVAWLRIQGAGWLALAAGALFTSGIILFCGALYAIALFGLPWSRVAPFGGGSFILGWLALAVLAVRWRG
ncbi:MAG: DUF423 domain-containing protein [Rhodospirillales bacterium]|nr:DUF423 domain-containing protein [Rhodospirillales bacterium]